MNGSRSTPSRPGDRPSLDALNRTIEGLEARIEGLMNAARDPRRSTASQDPRRPAEARPAIVETYNNTREPSSDPLREIRERQRMLGAGGDRTRRNDAPFPPREPRYPASRQDDLHQNDFRLDEHGHGDHRQNDLRIPEAVRPHMSLSEARRPIETFRSPAASRPLPAHAGLSAEQHSAREPDEFATRGIAQALANLRQELKQDISEGVAREMNALRTEIRNIRSIAEDQRFAEDLQGDLARLAEGINQLSRQSMPEAEGLRTEFDALRNVLDGLAREDSVQRIETRWQGLEERMQDLDSAALREELVALAYRIDDIKGQLGEMSDNPVIRALEQKLIAVATVMEQLGSRMQPHDTALVEQFASLDERLDEISRAIAVNGRASSAAATDPAILQRLEGRIGAIADQIDTLSRATANQGDPAEALSVRIETLTARIEELADEQATLRVEERLDQLSRLVQKVQQPADQTALIGYLEDISRKIDGLDHGAINETLVDRLDYLAQRIEELDHGQNRPLAAVSETAFGRIEDRLSDIAARLDETAKAPQGESEALRNLEAQIAHLSSLMSDPRPVTDLPAEFESRFASIENYMATNDEYIIEAARQAAEAVVEAYSRSGAAGANLASADMAALSALADDLRHLEDLTRGSEERTQHTFEALHTTLVQIADRLDGMEERFVAGEHGREPHYPSDPHRQEPSRTVATSPAAQKAAFAAGAAEYAIADNGQRDDYRSAELAPAFQSETDATADMMAETAFAGTVEAPAKPSLLAGLSRRFMPGAKAEPAKTGRAVLEPTPSIDPVDVLPAERENDLLEPGSGVPDVKKILERVRASQAAGEFEGGDRATSAERADYIAAARRAAKAAALETDPSQTGATAKDLRKAAKPAAGGSTFLRHKRPILMAVGAVLLALMAVPLVKSLADGDQTAPPTAIEAPAVNPAANEQPSAEEPSAEEPTQLPTDGTATDGADTTGEAAPALPSSEETATNHLTDPRPANGTPSTIEPSQPVAADGASLAGPLESQPSDVASAAVTPVERAPAAEQQAAIIVPEGIESKSLADAGAKGDPVALFEIGARYTEGRGVNPDLSEAANWYKLAADRGFAPAQYRLANLFEKGTGVTRDLAKAMTYYRQAANAGNASAMHNLAVLYASGAQGQPDYAAAVEWFGKASELGVVDSQFNLAILYARGNGIPQNLEESYKWFAIAAKGGDKDAAQKRDEVAKAMRKEQLENARAKADAWKPQPVDSNANAIDLPDEWAGGKPLTTASVDMEKAIRNIQAILNKNGFDAGTPDGKLGQKTTAAIRAFQTSVGQQPTGKINDALVKELLARNK